MDLGRERGSLDVDEEGEDRSLKRHRPSLPDLKTLKMTAYVRVGVDVNEGGVEVESVDVMNASGCVGEEAVVD